MTGRGGRRTGFSLIELLIVVAILGLLSVMGLRSWRNRVQKERVANVKANLNLIWHAQRSYYAYKGDFVDNFNALAIPDPSSEDRHYAYTLIIERSDFRARATRRGGTSGFQIGKSGVVTEF